MSRLVLESFLASPLGKFKSWKTPEGRSPQAAFFRAAATHRARVFRSGNQVGKTTAGAVDIALACCGWHPWFDRRPPIRAWVSGIDWDFGIGQIIWPALEAQLPKSAIRSITYRRRAAPVLPLHIEFMNGSSITFKSAEAGRTKFQGAPLDYVWLDEEHPSDVVEEARTRLLAKRGHLTCTLTPLLRLQWVKDLEKEATTKTFRASMIEAAEAGILDIEAVRNFEASLPERQRRVRVHGDFVALEGLVYPGLSRESHVARRVGASLRTDAQGVVAPWPLPPSWPRWASVDWGVSNPTAIVIVAEQPTQGRLIVERVYYASGIRASEWARLLKTRLPKLRVAMISDHDLQARSELEAEGITTTRADKDIDRGLECVERIMGKRCPDGAPGILFAETGDTDRGLGSCDASKLVWELEAYHYPRARPGRPDPVDRPVKVDDHAADALRYLCVAYERDQGGPPQPPVAIDRDRPDRYHGRDMLRMPRDEPDDWRRDPWDD